MPLKLITLNVEGHRHLDRWLPVMKREQPDVLCLQEVFKADLPRIESDLGMNIQFVPKINIAEQTKYNLKPYGLNGQAICTNSSSVKADDHQTHVFSGDINQINVFHKPNDGARLMQSAEIIKGNESFIIGNTHFTWSKGGEISDLQRKDFAKLQKIIQSYPELILCGDFNAPRGKEMFALFEELLIDNLPKSVQTTIDGNLHYAGDLQLVVDTIFSTPQYEVSNVRTIDGLSDHMAVVARVIKK